MEWDVWGVVQIMELVIETKKGCDDLESWWGFRTDGERNLVYRVLQRTQRWEKDKCFIEPNITFTENWRLSLFFLQKAESQSVSQPIQGVVAHVLYFLPRSSYTEISAVDAKNQATEKLVSVKVSGFPDNNHWLMLSHRANIADVFCSSCLPCSRVHAFACKTFARWIETVWRESYRWIQWET